MRRLSTLVLVAIPFAALAAEPTSLDGQAAPVPTSPLDRPVALGVYTTGWAGAYGAGGLGGRIRLQPWRRLGVDLFGEAYLVSTPHGLRHDHPIGFDLYSPLRLGSVTQVRPLLGMCVVASFIEPAEPQAPRADDVLVGAHLGAGLDVALSRWVSLFAEAKAVVWVGHQRTVQGWTGALANQIQPFLVGQGQVGVAVHFGPGQ